MTAPHPRFRIDAIERAQHQIPRVLTNSPCYHSDTLSDSLGMQVSLKIETVNPVRSFKGRGASFYVQELADARTRLVCASAGNFGQGMALATTQRGMQLDVFASHHANPLKIQRMAALGARIHRAGEDFDAAKAAGRAYAEEIGGFFVEDGRQPEISEGAGTIGLEILRDSDGLDAVVVPVGNGALICGIAAWIKAHEPQIQIIGVCASNAPAMEISWRAKHVIETPTADTIADGIAVRVPIPESIVDLQGIVDDIVLIDEAEIVHAMRLALGATGILLEPAGAVGVAALAQHRERFKGQRVATVLTGANASDADVQRLLAG